MTRGLKIVNKKNEFEFSLVKKKEKKELTQVFNAVTLYIIWN